MSLNREISKKRNHNWNSDRLFVGLDGRFYVAGQMGLHRASAVALALLARPVLRADGERDGHNG